MPELSSLLRQRLGSAPAPKTHPDADTLTAYAEKLLPATERSQVLQHISECANCRDVIALILPDGVPVQERQPAIVGAMNDGSYKTKRRWFLTPSFGLAASIVAMALGVGIVLEMPFSKHASSFKPLPTAQQQEAKAVPPPPPPEPSANVVDQNSTQSAQPPAAAVNAPDAQVAHKRSHEPEAKSSDAMNTERAAIPRNEQVITPSGAPTMRVERQQAVQPSQVQPAPSPRRDYVNVQVFAVQNGQTGAVQAQTADLPSAPATPQPTFALGQQPMFNAGMRQTAPLDTAGNSALGQQGTTTIYPLSASDHRTFGVTSKISQVGRQLHLKRIAPTIPSESLNDYAMFNPSLARSQNGEMAAKAPEKGEADLSQSQAFTSRALSHGLVGGQGSFSWKVAQGKLLKSNDFNHWVAGYTGGDDIDFSVVSVNGPEIWAGGNNAALVHSRDGGATWERIPLGASATGNITSLEVNRSQVQVRSSSGQSWSSPDGGSTWQMDN